MRADVYLYNEATAWVVAAADLAGKKAGALTKGFGPWEAGIRAGAFVPIHLVQDDPQIVRLVVGGPLLPEETEEWVGCVESWLNLEGGAVVLSAGTEYLDDPNDEWLTENSALHRFEVEPGRYRVRVYTYLTGKNGDYALGLVEGEATRYWNATREGEPLPSWIQAMDDDEFDPEDEDESLPYIGFLVHLEPLEGATPRHLDLDEGYPAIDSGRRRPVVCPAGLIAGPTILGLTDQPDPESIPIEPYPTGEEAAGLLLTPVHGGSVGVPVVAAHRVFAIAWMCSDGATPELRLVPPHGSGFAPSWPDRPIALFEQRVDGWVVRTAESGLKWEHLATMEEVAKALDGVPDGTRLELDVANPDEPLNAFDHPRQAPGWHRYAGTVRDGAWQVELSFPPLDAATLRSALSLAEQTMGGAQLSATEGEAAEVLKHVEKDFVLRTAQVEHRDGELTVPDPDHVPLLGVKLFRVRHGNTWAVDEVDDDVEGWDTAMEKLAEAFWAPRTDEVVLRGASGTFQMGNPSGYRFGHEVTTEMDRLMQDAGFAWLADLVHERFNEVVMRAYVGRGADRYAIGYVGLFGSMGLDVYSSFSSGASLTTSTITHQADEPGKGIFRSPSRAETMVELNELHDSRLPELADQHGGVVPALPSAEAVATMIDEFIVRSGV